MPVPAEFLAVERPKNTRVKKSGERYLVIKRTCKRVNGRNVPVELGMIGEIVNGVYVEKRAAPRLKEVEIKDYGEVNLNDKCKLIALDNHLASHRYTRLPNRATKYFILYRKPTTDNTPPFPRPF